MSGYRRRGRRLFTRTAPKARVPRKIIAINSNAGWHDYYVQRFNKTEHPDAAYLAMLYLFFALRDGELPCD